MGPRVRVSARRPTSANFYPPNTYANAYRDFENEICPFFYPPIGTRVWPVAVFFSAAGQTSGVVAAISLPLPAAVAADDDVASEDGARGHLVVDRVRDDAGGHGELDGRGVDDAHD
eukprot:scaffold112849_cov33-Phaeocystis_antarctica.AAC.1